MQKKTLQAMLKIYDEKLKELLTEQEYLEFAAKTARMTFAAEVMQCKDEGFKNFVFSNWDEITGSGTPGGDAE